jgi:hypothetical protein
MVPRSVADAVVLTAALLATPPAVAQLTSAGSQFWNQDSSGIEGEAEAGDTFGRAVVVGDFNCDGFDDLAIGSPYENVQFDCDGDGDAEPDECANAGAVNVIYGSARGLHASLGHADQILTQATSGVPGDPESGDHFGWALATMSILDMTCDDLVVGIPDEDIANAPFPDHVDAGMVVYFRGGPGGLTGDGAFQQGVDGVPEFPEDDDRFGAAIAQGPRVAGTGCVNDSWTLAIGVPGEDLGFDEDSDNGIVVLVTAGDCTFGSNLPDPFDCSPFSNVPPCQLLNPSLADAMGDSGFALAASRIDDRSPEAFLAIGVPRWQTGSSHPGRVGILRADGLGEFTVDLTTTCGQGLDGAAGAEENADRIGAALAIGDFDADGRADLAVGAPLENVDSNSVVDAGGVNVFYGGSHGGWVFPSGGGPPASPFFDQNETHFDGAGQADHFGSSLASGDFDADGFDDLVIGVPDEDLVGGDDAGMIHVLRGSANGVTATGDQAYDLDDANLPGQTQAQDYFGFALATGDFDGDGRDDLAVGTPGSTSNAAGGGVFVLFGGTGDAFLTRVEFQNAPDTYSEGNTTVILTLSRIGNRVYPISVGYNDAAAGTATAGADYESLGGTLSWAAGDSTPRQIVVTLLEDFLDEPAETIEIDLTPISGPGVDHRDSFTLAILDDDAQPVMQHSSACRIVNESIGTVNLTVTRSGGANGGVTASYATSNGTASAPSDYVAESGTVTFPVNSTAQTIGIAVTNDATVESPLEAFRVTLSNPGGGGALGATTVVTVLIRDDDGAPVLFASNFECGGTADWTGTVP